MKESNMHIPPFDNKNKPIVDIEDSRVPLNYFNMYLLYQKIFSTLE